MYNKPTIFPLDANGTIYAIEDENGRTIGTGSREVCELLLYIITKPFGASESLWPQNGSGNHRANIRAAITV